MDDVCVICNKECKRDSPGVVTMGEKDSKGINPASEKRDDNIQTVPVQRVYKE